MALVPTNYLPLTIRAIHIALMNVFNNIRVRKFDASGNTNNIVQEIRVPIVNAVQEKYQALRKERETGVKYYLPYPKMSLQWVSTQYNGDRDKGATAKRTWYDTSLGINDTDEFISDLNPVPYDLGFELAIQTESLSDFTQILEHILPGFRPERHIRVKEFRFLNVERDIKVRLEGISQEFIVEQGEEVRRLVNGNLQLMVEAFIYNPFTTNVGIIKEIRTRYLQGAQSAGLSAMSGYNTSGWDSSAAFPVPYDSSGTYSATNIEFDYYIDDVFN